MMFQLLIAIFSLFIISGCSDTPKVSQPREVSIAYLKSLCRGEHYRITGDYTIRGVVLANDWLGEINQGVIIVDDSGGIELSIKDEHINNNLPIFSEVTIFCNGLTLARIGRKIELGTHPIDDFPIGNIDQDMLDRYIRIEGVCDDYKHITKQISEIGVEDISRVIRFDNLRICDEEQGLLWCDIIEGEATETFRSLIDNKGDTLKVRMLPTCYYAKDKIPTKEISVIGVIDYTDNRYFLQIVNKWII